VLVSGQVAAQLPALLFEQVEPLPEEVLGNELVKAIVVGGGPSGSLAL